MFRFYICFEYIYVFIVFICLCFSLSSYTLFTLLYIISCFVCYLLSVCKRIKLTKGTQLIFRTASYHTGSIDACVFINKSEFVAGCQDGAISLWHINNKKPQAVVKEAHSGKWITAVCSYVGCLLLSKKRPSLID